MLSDIGGQASLTFGISNNNMANAVKIDSSSVADDEFYTVASANNDGLESRSTTVKFFTDIVSDTSNRTNANDASNDELH